MRPRRALLIHLSLLAVIVAGSASGEVWTKSYDIPSTGALPVLSAAMRADGNLLVGHSISADEICVAEASGTSSVKLHCYTAKAAFDTTVVPSNDGGWFVVGSRYNEQNVETPFVIRSDRTGAVVWNRTYRNPEHTRFTDAAQTRDGGLVVVGSMGRLHGNPYFDSAKAFMMKTSRAGAIEWQRTFDTSGVDELKDVIVASDRYVAGGWTGFGATVVSVDERGNEQWQSRFGGARVDAVGLAAKDEIVVSGRTYDFRREGTYWLARIDRSGKQLWQRAAPAAAGTLSNLTIQPGGDIVVHALSVTSRNSYFVAAFTSAGELRWERQFQLGRGRVHAAAGPSPDGGLILVGNALKTVDLYKLDRSGKGPACIEPGVTIPTIAFAPLDKPPADQPVESAVAALREETGSVSARIETVRQATECAPAAAAAAAAARQPAMEAPPSPAVETIERLVSRNVQWGTDMRALLTARDFAALDRLAEDFQRTRSRRPDGYLNASALFDELSYTRGFPSETIHLELMEAWRSAAPRSAAAAIASARTYSAYAWNARGSGFTQTVTDAAWKKFEQLRDRALAILRGAESFASSNPEYYVALIPLVPCEEAKRLAYDPEIGKLAYSLIFRTASLYFMPRWCGSPEEYRKLAEYAAERTRGTDGDYQYARIAWDAMLMEKKEDFARYAFDWRRMRQGFLDAIAKHPDWAVFHHRLAFTAWRLGDRGTAREMFLLPQLGWSDPVATIWSGRRSYETARAWALQGPAEPMFGVSGSPRPVPVSGSSLEPVRPTGWVATVASEWPPILMRNVIRLGDGTTLPQFSSFLVETPRGVVAVTALADPKLITEHEYTKEPQLRLDILRTKLASWTMFAPLAPSRTLKAAAFRFVTDLELPAKRAVVVTLAPTNEPLPVTPLKGSPPPKFGAGLRVYVVGCISGSAPCQQTAYAANAHAPMGGPDVHSFGVQFDDDVEWSEFIGSPVIDEEGRAIGVVTFRYFLSAGTPKRNRAMAEGLMVLQKPEVP